MNLSGQQPRVQAKPYNWAGAANVNWFPGQTQESLAAAGRAIQQQIAGMGSYNPNINVGGGAGGYAGLIGGDYGVQEMESMMNARMGRARGDFQSQIRQALIDLGVTDKSKLGNLGQYIDEDTISKAAENKYSQVARSQQAETQGRAASEADLAARGMLSSGQLTTNAENIVAQGEQSRYSALRDFLGAGASGLSQLGDLNDQLAMQLAQARADAADRAASMYQYGMTDPYGYGPDNPMGGPDVLGGPRGTQGYAGETALGRNAWLARNPGGNYQNYLNAWRRHAATGGY